MLNYDFFVVFLPPNYRKTKSVLPNVIRTNVLGNT